MEYLYASGVRPELALCVEYLSWNKEQRLYMAWLKALYGHLFVEPLSTSKPAGSPAGILDTKSP